LISTIDYPCVRGCIRAGTDDNPQHLPARHGRYCGRCRGRIDHALIQAPELASHILGNLISTGGGAGERVDSSREAPLPFNEAAFADVSELYAMLVYWTETWADYLEEIKPAPAARAWRRDSGTVAGLPAGMTPEAGAHEIGRMTSWLRTRLDTILSLAPEDVDEFDEAIRDVWRMNARWPRLEKPRYSDMPCPAAGCGARIAVFPPHAPGGVKSITCDNGHYYTEEEYDEMALDILAQRLAAARRARKDGRARQAGERTEKQQADDVRAHLWRKYGWTDGKSA
jgi:hypothetical protein